jgi:phosphoribosylformylglycinamidine synthase subunit PurS
MKFTAEINVMPQKALLDPQGKAVCQVLQKTGRKGIASVRMGKHIQIEIEAETEDKARKLTDDVCSKVLINPIMENYTFKIKKSE